MAVGFNSPKTPSSLARDGVDLIAHRRIGPVDYGRIRIGRLDGATGQTYLAQMRITWDEAKREVNLRKHGLDFADFEASFDRATALAIPTRASATGRRRDMLIGRWEHRLVVVVVISPLGLEALSLVSVRPAHRQERDLYAQCQAPAPLCSEPALHPTGLGRRGRQSRTEPG